MSDVTQTSKNALGSHIVHIFIYIYRILGVCNGDLRGTAGKKRGKATAMANSWLIHIVPKRTEKAHPVCILGYQMSHVSPLKLFSPHPDHSTESESLRLLVDHRSSIGERVVECRVSWYDR